MTAKATTGKTKARGKMRKSGLLLTLALGTMLAAVVATAGTARQAEAAFPDKIVFVSNRTTGPGVDNPTGDYEIFKMNPDGTGLKQLTSNSGDDLEPTLSPDGAKIAYQSEGIQTSNPQGDAEVYVMNALDGSGKTNLSNNGLGVGDSDPAFSLDGKQIAYTSQSKQTSNQEGDWEVYRVNALDGTGKKNLSDNGIDDYQPVFSPDGTKIAYTSRGVQTSNLQGDYEIYLMNTLDGTGKRNLSNNSINDYNPAFSPDGTKIAYESYGIQTSNPEGDVEVYRINALDGTRKKNLSNNGLYVDDYSPVFSLDGKRIAYTSHGIQTSNLEGDAEVYAMNALDGMGKINLSNNGSGIHDSGPAFSPDGAKVSYVSHGIQTSNPEGDFEVYVMNGRDGSGQTNLTNDPATDGVYVKEVR